MSLEDRLNELLNAWQKRALYAEQNAKLAGKSEITILEARFIRHGGMCYQNCMFELRQALKGKPYDSAVCEGEKKVSR